MGYYTDEFKAIARDNWGEMASARVSVCLLNGSNHLLQSQLMSIPAWTKSTNLLAADLVEPIGEPPPYGVSTLLVTTGTPTAWEYVGQDRAAVQEDRFVFWGLFHAYPAAGSAPLYLLTEDVVIGGSTAMSARFLWSGSDLVPSTLDGMEASGVIPVGSDGWWIAWCAFDVGAGGAAKGNAQSYRVYPAGGDATVGRGCYCAQLQLEAGVGTTGPRTADKQADGPWAPVFTVAAERRYQNGEIVTVEERGEVTLSINPIVTKRERRFGVVESQAWQARVTDIGGTLSQFELAGAWACVEVGFKAAGEWAVVAQGQIATANATDSLDVVMDVDSPMRSLIDGELRRHVFFDDEFGWASSIETVERDEDSDDYDNDEPGAGVTIASHTLIVDAKYEIEFLTATTFKVTNTETGAVEDNLGAGHAIGTDTPTLFSAIVVQSEGWTGTYAAGDTFTFATSKKRSGTNAISPVALLIELLTSSAFLGLRAFNVLEGVYYSSPLYDESGTWDAAIANYTTTKLKGQWSEGDKVVDLIQGILKVIHASIYTMPNGQLALWQSQPNERSAVSFNGDPQLGAVQILGMSKKDDLENVYNAVRYEYRHLSDGSEATFVRRDADTKYDREMMLPVDLGNWRCDIASLDAAASKLLTRVKNNRRSFEIRTVLAGAVLDMDDPIAFNDPVLRAFGQSLVREISFDVESNECLLVAQIDPVVLSAYAVVGDAFTTPPGTQVDDTKPIF